MKLMLCALCLLLTPLASAQDIEVTLDLQPKSEWTAEEVKLIQYAAEEAFRRMATSAVANCAYRYATKENKDQLRKSWGNQIPVINKSRKVKLTIAKKSLSANVLGQARVGSASVDRQRFSIDQLTIDLSSELLYQHLRGDKSLKPDNQWINVIAHEVAHTLGYTHGTGGSWSDNYPGYFVTEIGYCAMHNGKQGSTRRY